MARHVACPKEVKKVYVRSWYTTGHILYNVDRPDTVSLSKRNTGVYRASCCDMRLLVMIKTYISYWIPLSLNLFNVREGGRLSSYNAHHYLNALYLTPLQGRILTEPSKTRDVGPILNLSKPVGYILSRSDALFQTSERQKSDVSNPQVRLHSETWGSISLIRLDLLEADTYVPNFGLVRAAWGKEFPFPLVFDLAISSLRIQPKSWLDLHMMSPPAIKHILTTRSVDYI